MFVTGFFSMNSVKFPIWRSALHFTSAPLCRNKTEDLKGEIFLIYSQECFLREKEKNKSDFPHFLLAFLPHDFLICSNSELCFAHRGFTVMASSANKRINIDENKINN